MITITHTPEAGTLLDGTTKGDGTNHILNSGGRPWRWSRTLTAWYIPRSRDTAPNLALITTTAENLRTAGHTVTVTIQTGHRSTAEIEADRAERQQDRADGLAAKAERQTAAAHNAHQRARELADQVPFGQPILIGHYSEGRMRRHAQRIHDAMDATTAAATAAEETHRRAQLAATSTAAKHNPVTVANHPDHRAERDHPQPRRAHPHHRRHARRHPTHRDHPARHRCLPRPAHRRHRHRHILGKLGFSSRTEIATWAVQLGR